MRRLCDFMPNARPYYFVTTCGKVINANLKKYFATTFLTTDGYERLEIIFDYYNSGIKKGTIKRKYSVHRLVAIVYLGFNENGLPNGDPKELTVDHINGIKSDNMVQNLQLLTREDNYRKHVDSYVKKVKKPKVKREVVRKIPLSEFPKIIHSYNTGVFISELAKQYKVSQSSMTKMLKKQGVFRVRDTKRIPKSEYKNIFNKYTSGHKTKELAEFYGVSTTSILKIVRLIRASQPC